MDAANFISSISVNQKWNSCTGKCLKNYDLVLALIIDKNSPGLTLKSKEYFSEISSTGFNSVTITSLSSWSQ